MRIRWREIFIENSSYKLVALIIAIILWLTILGRRDFVLQKNIEVEVVTNSQVAIQATSAEFVKVKVSGPRTALKKFVDSGVSQLISLDLSEKNEGFYDVEIPAGKIDVPFGVKVVSVKPRRIQVKLVKRESKGNDSGE